MYVKTWSIISGRQRVVKMHLHASFLQRMFLQQTNEWVNKWMNTNRWSYSTLWFSRPRVNSPSSELPGLCSSLSQVKLISSLPSTSTPWLVFVLEKGLTHLCMPSGLLYWPDPLQMLNLCLQSEWISENSYTANSSVLVKICSFNLTAS